MIGISATVYELWLPSGNAPFSLPVAATFDDRSGGGQQTGTVTIGRSELFSITASPSSATLRNTVVLDGEPVESRVVVDGLWLDGWHAAVETGLQCSLVGLLENGDAPVPCTYGKDAGALCACMPAENFTGFTPAPDCAPVALGDDCLTLRVTGTQADPVKHRVTITHPDLMDDDGASFEVHVHQPWLPLKVRYEDGRDEDGTLHHFDLPRIANIDEAVCGARYVTQALRFSTKFEGTLEFEVAGLVGLSSDAAIATFDGSVLQGRSNGSATIELRCGSCGDETPALGTVEATVSDDTPVHVARIAAFAVTGVDSTLWDGGEVSSSGAEAAPLLMRVDTEISALGQPAEVVARAVLRRGQSFTLPREEIVLAAKRPNDAILLTDGAAEAPPPLYGARASPAAEYIAAWSCFGVASTADPRAGVATVKVDLPDSPDSLALVPGGDAATYGLLAWAADPAAAGEIGVRAALDFTTHAVYGTTEVDVTHRCSYTLYVGPVPYPISPNGTAASASPGHADDGDRTAIDCGDPRILRPQRQAGSGISGRRYAASLYHRGHRGRPDQRRGLARAR